MSNRDGSIWLTFNGEIFNYVELRQELEQKGHRFATKSDTEVILHQYEEKGEGCVSDFNGQWAFALWDGRRRKLFLSRDRFGVRPLFYSFVGPQFLFGSEAKALFAHPGVKRELDVKALDQIFTFWTPMAPRTIFRQISEVPPGHSLSICRERKRIYAHWRPDYQTMPGPVDGQRCADELLELLVDATRIRLRSDVPVGAYLSGGLDSAVVTGIMKRKLAVDPLRTFAVTFDDPEFDESQHQLDVVSHLHTDHSQTQVSGSDIASSFPNVIWHSERPVVRTAPAPLLRLSEAVRDRGYKVVLTGEGADEVLGGYDIFKEAKIRAFWASQPESVRRPLLLRRLYPYLNQVQAQSDAYLKAFFRGDVGPVSPFYSHLPRWQLTSRLKVLFSADVKAELASYDAYDELSDTLPTGFDQWDLFSRAQYLEMAVLLPGYILSSQGDRMAMAHGVEGRFPFLDHRVVAFAARLPPSLKMKVLKEKYLLKLATRQLVPSAVRQRPKQPYRAPEASSFVTPDRRGRQEDYVEALLAPGRVSEDGIFDPSAVSRLLSKARSGRMIGIKDNMGFLGVLSTQLVVDRFIRPSRAA
jgi:asparagine synthase (glutamine-hydrolysing)